MTTPLYVYVAPCGISSDVSGKLAAFISRVSELVFL
jgi:hypothetical protein